jgi:hypothetical protein
MYTDMSNQVSLITEIGNNALTGYPEITYFHDSYFNVVANSQNVQYRSVTFRDKNGFQER